MHCIYRPFAALRKIATEPAGEIGVALRRCLTGHETDKGVWVDTHDSDGVYADRAFHLVVHTQ